MTRGSFRGGFDRGASGLRVMLVPFTGTKDRNSVTAGFLLNCVSWTSEKSNSFVSHLDSQRSHTPNTAGIFSTCGLRLLNRLLCFGLFRLKFVNLVAEAVDFLVETVNSVVNGSNLHPETVPFTLSPLATLE